MAATNFFVLPFKELSYRWARIQQIMIEHDIEALLVNDNTSLCWLTGRIFAGYAYISTQHEPLFFVRRPVELTGNNVVYIRKPEQIASTLSDMGYPSPKSIALEGDVATYNEYNRLRNIFPILPTSIHPTATTITRRARSVKSEYEIEQIRLSGVKHSQLYSMVTSIYRRGMSDHDIAIELEYQARKLGAVGNMRIFGRSMEVFIGSILTGDNASAPSPYDFALGGGGMDPSLPVGCNGTVIEPGMTLMVDQGGNFGSYMTDMTRLFSLGSLPDIAYRAHQCALNMQQQMCSMVRVGSSTADIYNMSIELAQQEGLSEYFMGHKQQAGFVGHGVGMEVNELPVLAPRSREIFEAGCVFAYEPKFTLPTIGAAGIENTFVVRESGVEKLTIFEEDIIKLD